MSKSTQVILGVEVGVERNEGTFRRVDYAFGKRNALVSIDVPGLSKPVTASIDTDDPTVWTVAQEMQRTGGRFQFRIEIHRDRSVDPTIPFDEVPKDTTSRHRRLVWMQAAGAAGSAPAATPAPMASQSVAAGDPTDPRIYPKVEGQPLVCPLCGDLIGTHPARKHMATGRFAHVDCLTAEQTGQANPAPAPAPTAAPAPAPMAQAEPTRPGPRRMEAKPYERQDSDGLLNPGSYAIQAAVGMVELADEMLTAKRLRDGEQGPPPLHHVKFLAARLLQAADQVQRGMRSDGHFDRMDNSHTRARGAVRSAMVHFPFPFVGEPGALEGLRNRWVDDVATYAVGLITIAIELDR